MFGSDSAEFGDFRSPGGTLRLDFSAEAGGFRLDFGPHFGSQRADFGGELVQAAMRSSRDLLQEADARFHIGTIGLPIAGINRGVGHR